MPNRWQARGPPADQLRLARDSREGDTVFPSARTHYPPLTQQLRSAGATVVLVQFGEMESLAGPWELPRFLEAYALLLDEVNAVTPVKSWWPRFRPPVSHPP